MISERKPRKSVAFSEGTTIVGSNGEVTETNGTSDKSSAESHSTSMSSEVLKAVIASVRRNADKLPTNCQARKF